MKPGGLPMNMFSPLPPPEPESFDAPEYFVSVFRMLGFILFVGPYLWIGLQWVSR